MLCLRLSVSAENTERRDGYNAARDVYLQQQEQEFQQYAEAQGAVIVGLVNVHQAIQDGDPQLLLFLQQLVHAQTQLLQLSQEIEAHMVQDYGQDSPWVQGMHENVALAQATLTDFQNQLQQLQEQEHIEQQQAAQQQQQAQQQQVLQMQEDALTAVELYQQALTAGDPQAPQLLAVAIQAQEGAVQAIMILVQGVLGEIAEGGEAGDPELVGAMLEALTNEQQLLAELQQQGQGSVGQLGTPSGSPQGSPPASPGAEGSASFVGYSPAGNMCSLQGLQCLLGGPIAQVSNTLRSFTLRANSDFLGNSLPKGSLSKSVVSGGPHGFEKSHKGSSGFNVCLTPQRSITTSTFFPSTAVIRQQRMGYLEGSLGGLFARPYQIFSSVERYQQDLECKVNVAQVGLIASPTVLFKTGLAFTYTKEASQALYGIKIGKAAGAAQVTFETKSLSALAAWNTDKAGVTGCLTGCYSWGHMKNTRYFSHAQGEAQAKGNPDIKLFGGLAQLGYNLEFSKNFFVTPYVECMFVSAMWSPYEEITGPFPSKISQSKEHVLEKSIGLRNCWSITESSQLQTWIVGVSGQHTTAGLHARPIIAPLSLYKVSIPGHRRTYLQGEAGLSYNLHLTMDLDIGLYGSIRIEHMKHLTSQHIKCVFRYTY